MAITLSGSANPVIPLSTNFLLCPPKLAGRSTVTSSHIITIVLQGYIYVMVLMFSYPSPSSLNPILCYKCLKCSLYLHCYILWTISLLLVNYNLRSSCAINKWVWGSTYMSNISCPSGSSLLVVRLFKSISLPALHAGCNFNSSSAYATTYYNWLKKLDENKEQIEIRWSMVNVCMFQLLGGPFDSN